MTLPFGSYDQLRCRGNEYVTDQTLNRPFYRFFQNDLHLDSLLTSHMADDLIHNTGGASKENETALNGDRQVILSCGFNKTTNSDDIEDVFEDVFDGPTGEVLGIYRIKGWQTLVDEQPKNLGGHMLTFRVQKNGLLSDNPTTYYKKILKDTLTFRGFYGGTLVFECPPAYHVDAESSSATTYQTGSSASNQRLQLIGGQTRSSLISFEDCHCEVIIRNCNLTLDNLAARTTVSGWGGRDQLDFDKIYINTSKADGRSEGECMIKPSKTEVWTPLNVNKVINISGCNNVLIKHCCIGY